MRSERGDDCSGLVAMTGLEDLKVVANIYDFMARIRDLRGDSTEPLWYRGVSKANYSLVPTLYRVGEGQSVQDVLRGEAAILDQFKLRSIPFIGNHPESDWEWTFLMQHHGVPTRLLDWTENPFVAAYFALSRVKSHVGGQEDFSDAAVWVLKPNSWNRRSLAHISYNGGILSTADSNLSSYGPGSGNTAMNNYPLAIYGAHNSPRIVAQRGTFTVFGQMMDAMELIRDKGDFPEDCLIKIVLPTDALVELKRSLTDLGITASVVFPDLDGLARELCWSFGYGG